MVPIIAALAANPAVGVAAQQAIKELTPVAKRALRMVSPSLFAGWGAPVLLTSCFAAGVAVGWFTAPRRGAVMRRKVRDAVSAQVNELSARARKQSQNVLTWARAQNSPSSQHSVH